MNMIKSISIIALLVFGQAALSCAVGSDLKDGKYRGEYSFIEVEVTVEDGKVAEIEILKHGGGGDEYAAMIEPLSGEIIANQSTEIDTITGATVSSKYYKEAVENALKKAR